MKIGTIRRIDELGRIVIPKGIRQELRIRTGDNLEVYIEEDNIILKKHSALNKIEQIGTIIRQVLKEITKADIIITDKDKIIIDSTKEYIEKEISEELLKILEERHMIIRENIIITDKLDKAYFLINPIIINGDVIGSIILKSKKEIGNKDIDAVKILTLFLTKYIE